MEGLHLERHTYRLTELTPADIGALEFLGVEIDVNTKAGIITILKDTAKRDHGFCKDEDSVLLAKTVIENMKQNRCEK